MLFFAIQSRSSCGKLIIMKFYLFYLISIRSLYSKRTKEYKGLYYPLSFALLLINLCTVIFLVFNLLTRLFLISFDFTRFQLLGLGFLFAIGFNVFILRLVKSRLKKLEYLSLRKIIASNYKNSKKIWGWIFVLLTIFVFFGVIILTTILKNVPL